MTPEPRYLPISTYALKYGVTRQTVWKWLRAGLLDYYRMGHLIRIKDQLPAESNSLDNTRQG